METLPKRVQEAVEKAKTNGHTVAGIAKLCGISRQAVYQWISGETKTISGENLVELSELSGYSARWIISGKGRKVIALTSDEATMVKAMSVCDPAVKDMLLLMARAEIDKAVEKSKAA